MQNPANVPTAEIPAGFRINFATDSCQKNCAVVGAGTPSSGPDSSGGGSFQCWKRTAELPLGISPAEMGFDRVHGSGTCSATISGSTRSYAIGNLRGFSATLTHCIALCEESSWCVGVSAQSTTTPAAATGIGCRLEVRAISQVQDSLLPPGFWKHTGSVADTCQSDCAVLGTSTEMPDYECWKRVSTQPTAKTPAQMGFEKLPGSGKCSATPSAAASAGYPASSFHCGIGNAHGHAASVEHCISYCAANPSWCIGISSQSTGTHCHLHANSLQDSVPDASLPAGFSKEQHLRLATDCRLHAWGVNSVLESDLPLGFSKHTSSSSESCHDSCGVLGNDSSGGGFQCWRKKQIWNSIPQLAAPSAASSTLLELAPEQGTCSAGRTDDYSMRKRYIPIAHLRGKTIHANHCVALCAARASWCVAATVLVNPPGVQQPSTPEGIECHLAARFIEDVPDSQIPGGFRKFGGTAADHCQRDCFAIAIDTQSSGWQCYWLSPANAATAMSTVKTVPEMGFEQVDGMDRVCWIRETGDPASREQNKIAGVRGYAASLSHCVALCEPFAWCIGVTVQRDGSPGSHANSRECRLLARTIADVPHSDVPWGFMKNDHSGCLRNCEIRGTQLRSGRDFYTSDAGTAGGSGSGWAALARGGVSRRCIWGFGSCRCDGCGWSSGSLTEISGDLGFSQEPTHNKGGCATRPSSGHNGRPISDVRGRASSLMACARMCHAAAGWCLGFSFDGRHEHEQLAENCHLEATSAHLVSEEADVPPGFRKVWDSMTCNHDCKVWDASDRWSFATDEGSEDIKCYVKPQHRYSEAFRNHGGGDQFQLLGEGVCSGATGGQSNADAHYPVAAVEGSVHSREECTAKCTEGACVGVTYGVFLYDNSGEGASAAPQIPGAAPAPSSTSTQAASDSVCFLHAKDIYDWPENSPSAEWQKEFWTDSGLRACVRNCGVRGAFQIPGIPPGWTAQWTRSIDSSIADVRGKASSVADCVELCAGRSWCTAVSAEVYPQGNQCHLKLRNLSDVPSSAGVTSGQSSAFPPGFARNFEAGDCHENCFAIGVDGRSGFECWRKTENFERFGMTRSGDEYRGFEHVAIADFRPLWRKSDVNSEKKDGFCSTRATFPHRRIAGAAGSVASLQSCIESCGRLSWCIGVSGQRQTRGTVCHLHAADLDAVEQTGVPAGFVKDTLAVAHGHDAASLRRRNAYTIPPCEHNCEVFSSDGSGHGFECWRRKTGLVRETSTVRPSLIHLMSTYSYIFGGDCTGSPTSAQGSNSIGVATVRGHARSAAHCLQLCSGGSWCVGVGLYAGTSTSSPGMGGDSGQCHLNARTITDVPMSQLPPTAFWITYDADEHGASSSTCTKNCAVIGHDNTDSNRRCWKKRDQHGAVAGTSSSVLASSSATSRSSFSPQQLGFERVPGSGLCSETGGWNVVPRVITTRSAAALGRRAASPAHCMAICLEPGRRDWCIGVSVSSQAGAEGTECRLVARQGAPAVPGVDACESNCVIRGSDGSGAGFECWRRAVQPGRRSAAEMGFEQVSVGSAGQCSAAPSAPGREVADFRGVAGSVSDCMDLCESHKAWCIAVSVKPSGGSNGVNVAEDVNCHLKAENVLSVTPGTEIPRGFSRHAVAGACQQNCGVLGSDGDTGSGFQCWRLTTRSVSGAQLPTERGLPFQKVGETGSGLCSTSPYGPHLGVANVRGFAASPAACAALCDGFPWCVAVSSQQSSDGGACHLEPRSLEEVRDPEIVAVGFVKFLAAPATACRKDCAILGTDGSGDGFECWRKTEPVSTSRLPAQMGFKKLPATGQCSVTEGDPRVMISDVRGYAASAAHCMALCETRTWCIAVSAQSGTISFSTGQQNSFSCHLEIRSIADVSDAEVPSGFLKDFAAGGCQQNCAVQSAGMPPGGSSGSFECWVKNPTPPLAKTVAGMGFERVPGTGVCSEKPAPPHKPIAQVRGRAFSLAHCVALCEAQPRWCVAVSVQVAGRECYLQAWDIEELDDSTDVPPGFTKHSGSPTNTCRSHCSARGVATVAAGVPTPTTGGPFQCYRKIAVSRARLPTQMGFELIPGSGQCATSAAGPGNRIADVRGAVGSLEDCLSLCEARASWCSGASAQSTHASTTGGAIACHLESWTSVGDVLDIDVPVGFVKDAGTPATTCQSSCMPAAVDSTGGADYRSFQCWKKQGSFPPPVRGEGEMGFTSAGGGSGVCATGSTAGSLRIPSYSGNVSSSQNCMALCEARSAWCVAVSVQTTGPAAGSPYRTCQLHAASIDDVSTSAVDEVPLGFVRTTHNSDNVGPASPQPETSETPATYCQNDCAASGSYEFPEWSGQGFKCWRRQSALATKRSPQEMGFVRIPGDGVCSGTLRSPHYRLPYTEGFVASTAHCISLCADAGADACIGASAQTSEPTPTGISCRLFATSQQALAEASAEDALPPGFYTGPAGAPPDGCQSDCAVLGVDSESMGAGLPPGFVLHFTHDACQSDCVVLGLDGSTGFQCWRRTNVPTSTSMTAVSGFTSVAGTGVCSAAKTVLFRPGPPHTIQRLRVSATALLSCSDKAGAISSPVFPRLKSSQKKTEESLAQLGFELVEREEGVTKVSLARTLLADATCWRAHCIACSAMPSKSSILQLFFFFAMPPEIKWVMLLDDDTWPLSSWTVHTLTNDDICPFVNFNDLTLGLCLSTYHVPMVHANFFHCMPTLNMASRSWENLNDVQEQVAFHRLIASTNLDGLIEMLADREAALHQIAAFGSGCKMWPQVANEHEAEQEQASATSVAAVGKIVDVRMLHVHERAIGRFVTRCLGETSALQAHDQGTQLRFKSSIACELLDF
eukprot:g2159.t1